MSSFSENEYLIWIDTLLKEGKEVQIPVSGMSMFPFLMKDDIIRISPITYEELEIGQIIVFIQNNKFIAHRLIHFSGGICHTRGDANLNPDKAIAFKDVKGKVGGIVSSRWFLAKHSIGRLGKILAKTAPVTAVLFWLSGRISYAVVVFFRRLKSSLFI